MTGYSEVGDQSDLSFRIADQPLSKHTSTLNCCPR